MANVINDTVKRKATEILLTAFVSIGIAVLQNFLSANGVECGPIINPMEVGVVGGGLSTLKIAFQTVAKVAVT